MGISMRSTGDTGAIDWAGGMGGTVSEASPLLLSPA